MCGIPIRSTIVAIPAVDNRRSVAEKRENQVKRPKPSSCSLLIRAFQSTNITSLSRITS